MPKPAREPSAETGDSETETSARATAPEYPAAASEAAGSRTASLAIHDALSNPSEEASVSAPRHPLKALPLRQGRAELKAPGARSIEHQKQ